jgi:hypothetical protein
MALAREPAHLEALRALFANEGGMYDDLLASIKEHNY